MAEKALPAKAKEIVERIQAAQKAAGCKPVWEPEEQAALLEMLVLALYGITPNKDQESRRAEVRSTLAGDGRLMYCSNMKKYAIGEDEEKQPAKPEYK